MNFVSELTTKALSNGIRKTCAPYQARWDATVGGMGSLAI